MSVNKNSYQSKLSKVLAALLSVSLTFILVFSFLYIIKEANHDCTGDGCEICFFINQCENNIKVRSGGISKPCSIIHIILVISSFCFFLSETDILWNTLITQKVRLNN